MLTTTQTLESRPGRARPAPPARPDLGDRVPRWTAAIAIASLAVLAPHGPSNTAPADVFILLAIVSALLWAGRTTKRLKFPYVIGVGTMVIAGCLAALFSEYPHEGLTAIIIDIFLLGWVTTVANVGRTEAAAGFLLRAWCVTGSLWGVGLLAFFGRPDTADNPARASFTLGDSNGAGLYFAVTIMIVLAGCWPRRLRWRVPVLICLLVDLLLTGSLGGIFGLLAGLGLALVVRTAARRGGAAAVVLFLVLAVVSVATYEVMHRYQVVERAQSSPNVLLRDSIGREQQSAWEREMITQESLHLWSTSSLLGLGPNATKSTLTQELAPYPKEAHDDWTASLVERGVMGFTGLLLLVGEITVRAFRVGSRQRLGPGLSAALPAPEFLVGALATLAVNSFTHQILHDRASWTLLGLLAAFCMWRGKDDGAEHWEESPGNSVISSAARGPTG
jgi:hypothetical protein